MLKPDGRYLITGGTGKLGQALIARLWSMGIKKLAVIARSETKLFALKSKYPGIETFSGCVSDPSIMKQASRLALDGVFHLAAYKQLVMAEQEPRQCVVSNVEGMDNLLVSLEKKCVAPDFILFVSSSAAAEVKGVYGATKFIAEKLLHQYSAYNLGTACRVIRFANLWKGEGSFYWNWMDAIQRNHPIQITDPRATRFFITMDGAVDQILDSITGPYFLSYQSAKAVSMQTVMDAFSHFYKYDKFQVTGLRPGEVLRQTVDGINFSDEAEQYTADEFESEFLCPTK